MTAEKFPCERCGICCRNIGNASFAKDMVLPSGVCRHLDEETNLCRIYSTRPVFCNVDKFYDEYLSQKMTRAEFYRQNKNACRKIQGLETSSDTAEVEEWALPAIQNLNNAQNSDAADKLKNLDGELTLDKMSRKDRKIYEDNGIVPFQKIVSASPTALPPVILKQMKDQQWTSFEAAAENPAEYETAAQHLDNYIDLMPPAERKDVCYDLFQDFSHERNKTKGDFFAEKMLAKISDTRDVDKLLSIVEYFEKKHDIAKAEPFYFTLYEIFHRGEGTEKNLDKAINFLKASVSGINTDKKRAALRELYEEKFSDLEAEARTQKAFESVIADNIQFAKTDYAIYLRDKGKFAEAIHWFVADGKFAEAYKIVNLKVKEKIDSAVNEFTENGAADNEYAKALQLMQSKFESLQDIFAFDKPGKTPLTYVGIALMYTFFGFLYAVFRTAKRSFLALAAGLLITGAIFFGCREIEHLGLSATAVMIWTFVLIYLDVRRRKKFVAACELRRKLPPHPELDESDAVFKDSEKIVTQSKKSWALILPVLTTLFCAFMTLGVLEMSPAEKDQLLSQMKTEQEISEPSPPQVDNRDKVREAVDRTASFKPNKTLASESSEKVKEPPPPKDEKLPERKAESPKENSNPASPLNPLLTQTDFGKVFSAYYLAINERRYSDAYSHITAACRKRLGSIESFAEGHKNTLSVEILDFQQTSASSDAVNITYRLCARDKVAEGVKVMFFNGQATLVNKNGKWLIDNISSTLVNSHIE